MAFLFKRKSKDIDVNGQAVVDSAFARRQSAVQKFEQEHDARPRFKTVDDVEDRPKIVEEDDGDIPPPPPDDDDAPPPPPLPVPLHLDKPAPAAKAKSASPPLPPASKTPPQSKTPPPGPKASPPPAAKVTGRPMSGSKDKGGSASPSSATKKSPADSEYIEFTVVPLLLRSGVSYDEANKYGDQIKGLSEGDVARIMSSAMLLQDDVEKRRIKVPASFETALLNDQFWVKGQKATNRKSFVYYAPVAGQPSDRPQSGSHESASPKPRPESSRSRQSFSGGPVHVPTGEEGDASRYKAATRRDKAESVSKDLQDLVQTLSKLEEGREP